jgi:hypothetical protein
VTEVQVGTAVIAYIEPHEGQAQAFNRWYERDHFYAAATAGPGAFSGARWVATRACKAVRPAGGTWFGDPARGSYLTTVWLLEDTQDEWDAWVARQMETLRLQPRRMFDGRDHLHTAVYGFRGEHRYVRDGVATATALDHPFAGVIAIAADAYASGGLSVMHEIAGPEIPVVALLVPERTILSQSEPPPFDFVLGFTAGDPIAAWEARVAPALPRLSVGFASPFLRTIPGTDAYTDDL